MRLNVTKLFILNLLNLLINFNKGEQMNIDLEKLNIPDEEIEGLAAAFEEWEEPQLFPPPVGPGPKNAIIADAELNFNQGTKILNGQFSFSIQGGEDDGGRVSFVRLSSKMFSRNGNQSSQMLDMVKSSGIDRKPSTIRDLAETIQDIAENEKKLRIDTDLEAYCKKCAEAAKRELLGLEEDADDDDVKIAMKELKGNELKKFRTAFRKASTPFRNYKSIPKDSKGKYVDSVTCPVCGDVLTVRSILRRFLAPKEEE